MRGRFSTSKGHAIPASQPLDEPRRRSHRGGAAARDHGGIARVVRSVRRPAQHGDDARRGDDRPGARDRPACLGRLAAFLRRARAALRGGARDRRGRRTDGARHRAGASGVGQRLVDRRACACCRRDPRADPRTRSGRCARAEAAMAGRAAGRRLGSREPIYCAPRSCASGAQRITPYASAPRRDLGALATISARPPSARLSSASRLRFAPLRGGSRAAWP